MSWKTVALGDVCSIVNGGTPKSEVAEYWDGDLNWITPKEMGKLLSREISSTERKITDKGMKNSSAKLLPINSVILSSRAPIGHLAINKALMATNQGCKGLVPTEVLNYEYLYYFLSHSKQLLNDMGSGATFKELSGSKLATVKIPLPPLSIQIKIVAKLDAIFSEIDKATSATTANAKNAEALFQSYLKEVFDSENRKCKGVPLDSFCDFLNGFAFKSTDAIESSNTQLLRMGNLYGNNLDLERSPVFYPNSFKNIYSKFTLNVGDIVVSLTGTVGKRDYGYAIKVPDSSVDLLLNQRLLKIHNLDFSRVNYDYFNFYLHSSLFLDELYKSANGTRQANLSSEYIKKMKIPLCTISEQLTHVKSLMLLKENCESLRETSFEKIKSLMLLKQSILKQAFNGELVKE